MGIFRRKQKNVSQQAIYKMITDTGNGFYAWNGKLYQSDIVRACIKPKTKAIGKLVAKHIRESVTDTGKKIDVNPQPYIRFLLEEPNEFMTGQMLREKVANQLQLNGNAFILIVRDSMGLPCALYPVPCTSVEAKYIDNVLHLKFYYLNGKYNTFPYTEIIHLRDDFFFNDIFGDSPAGALAELMNSVSVIDQGFIKAIKNSAIVRWLLKYTQSMRDEDLKNNAQKFAENYLQISNGALGVAAVDAKAEATQITPNDFVPNASQIDRQTQRIYKFFNTNEKIVNSTYTENEWIAYYEANIEPLAQQMAEEFTRKLFTRRERGYGNKIIFEASSLTYASMATKLALSGMIDRGALLVNEWRGYMNLAPVDGGDEPLLRKDTGTLKEGTKTGGGEDE